MEKQHDLPLLGGKTYQNPLHFQNSKQTNPDPFIMPYCGRYYCYSSDAGGVNLSVSNDLVHWEYRGYATTEAGRQEYWAPCAIYHDGWFYLYYSTAPEGVFDCHEERLRVARSRRPDTNFTLIHELFSTFSLDAHVVRDSGNNLWLFYSTNEHMGCDENAAGTVILADRLLNPVTLEGDPREVTLPSIEQEVYEKNRFGDGRNWHTIEGAFYLERHGTAYVMYSANAFVRENYFVGYSSAKKNGDIGSLNWKKYPNNHAWNPLLRRSSVVEGTGHNSVAIAPNLMDHWLIYHGRNLSDKLIEGTEQRQMRIDPLLFDGARLATNAPSHIPQRAPRQPFFFDRFIAESTLWVTACGATYCNENALCTESAGVTLHHLSEAVSSYVLEVWCATQPTHMGARYGVLLWFMNELNYLEARFDAGKRTLSLVLSRGGVQSVLQTVPARFDFTTYHLLRAQRCFDLFEVQVDGIFLSAQISLPFGKVGLFSRYTAAQFSAFSLTEGVDLWGHTLGSLSLLFTSNFPLCEVAGEIRNLSPHTATLRSTEIFFGDFTQEYHFALLRADAELSCTICEGPEGRVILRAIPAFVVVLSCCDTGETELLRVPLTHNDFSVYLTYENEHAAIWVSGQSITCSTNGCTLLGGEFSLYGTSLRSFTMINSKILK